jgi:hypothetical protein
MKRVVRILFTTATALVLSTGVVLADSPHVVGSPKITVGSNSLTVAASIAGLGNVPSATFDLVGTVDVFSRCYNRGGNKPQADNKQETINVDTTVTFPVRNGRTNASFTIAPLSTLQCPGNQVVRIESFSWDLDILYQGDVLVHTEGSNP